MAPGDIQAAFAQAAAEDGIVLGSRSFDWLCEQGHMTNLPSGGTPCDRSQGVDKHTKLRAQWIPALTVRSRGHAG